MGRESRTNEILQNGQRFRQVTQQQIQQAQEPQQGTAGITGYANLGPDEYGIQETLFIPVCRRVQVRPPAGKNPDEYAAEQNEAINAGDVAFELEGETVRVLIENDLWIEYGPAQSKWFLRRTGMRKVPPVESLIIVPDTARKDFLGLGK